MQRTLFWVLLLLFIGLSAWWSVYFPYKPDRLYAAIPDNAVLVSKHEELARRWKTLVRNPLVKCVLTSSGIAGEEIEEAAADPNINGIFERFAARNTVVAYVPVFGETAEPAWILVSWAGIYGQLLKWGLAMNLIPGFKKIRLEHGEKAWLLDRPRSLRSDAGNSENQAGQAVSEDNAGKFSAPYLSVSVAEGMLLASLSPDPGGSERLADAVRQKTRPARGYPPWRLKGNSIARDQGWFQCVRPIPRYFSYAFTSLNERAASGWIRGKDFAGRRTEGAKGKRAFSSVSPAAGEKQFWDSITTGMGQYLVNASDAFITFPFSRVEPLMAHMNAPVDMRCGAIMALLESNAVENASVVLCLLRGNFSGRLFGFKAPTIMAALQVREGVAATEIVTGILDEINAEYAWTLIPLITPNGVPEAGPEWTLIGVGEGRPGAFSLLKPRDRPGFGLGRGWLVFSSNAAALSAFLAENPKSETADAWKGAFEQFDKNADDVLACAWANPEPTGRALRNGIAVYSLAQMARNAPENNKAHERPPNIKAWIQGASAIKNCALRLRAAGRELKLEFQLGESG